jgi:hypothetical protein
VTALGLADISQKGLEPLNQIWRSPPFNRPTIIGFMLLSIDGSIAYFRNIFIRNEMTE